MADIAQRFTSFHGECKIFLPSCLKFPFPSYLRFIQFKETIYIHKIFADTFKQNLYSKSADESCTVQQLGLHYIKVHDMSAVGIRLIEPPLITLTFLRTQTFNSLTYDLNPLMFVCNTCCPEISLISLTSNIFPSLLTNE